MGRLVRFSQKIDRWPLRVLDRNFGKNVAERGYIFGVLRRVLVPDSPHINVSNFSHLIVVNFESNERT